MCRIGRTPSITRSNLFRSLIVGCVACFVTAFASANTDKIDAQLDVLAKRIKLNKIENGIRNGDRNVFSMLPAKGYRNGVSDFLKRNNVYANPAYSFTQCDTNGKLTRNGPAPGCVVSLKLARKNLDGTYSDIGIRAEWAIGVGQERFQPNNSAYAEHISSGDGVIESILK